MFCEHDAASPESVAVAAADPTVLSKTGSARFTTGSSRAAYRRRVSTLAGIAVALAVPGLAVLPATAVWDVELPGVAVDPDELPREVKTNSSAPSATTTTINRRIVRRLIEP